MNIGTLTPAIEPLNLLGNQQHISELERVMLAAVGNTGGLIQPAEALALYHLGQRLPTGSRVLEIGSYLGASTTAIGHAIAGRGIELYSLDCWFDYKSQGFFDHTLAGTTTTDQEIFLRFLGNTRFLGQQLRILKGTSQQFKELLPSCFFDLIFIDAAHDYDNVCHDIRLALRTVVPGGIICGHDYHGDGEGVRAAVDELIGESRDMSCKGLINGTSIWYCAGPKNTTFTADRS